ncbi:MAG: hypothetical protein PHX51_01970 [Clostridia bacterium]|nr:hypothetical protein [Clostridia bacterium]
MKKLHIWFLIGAIMLVIVCQLVWAFVAKVDTVVEVSGVYKDGLVRCYLPVEEATKLNSGMDVKVNDKYSGRIQTMSQSPISKSEIIERLSANDYTLAMMKLTDWNIEITILTDEKLSEDLLCNVIIAVSSNHPIEFLF